MIPRPQQHTPRQPGAPAFLLTLHTCSPHPQTTDSDVWETDFASLTHPFPCHGALMRAVISPQVGTFVRRSLSTGPLSTGPGEQVTAKLGLPNIFLTNRLNCFLNLVQERQAAGSNVHRGDKTRVLGTFGQWQWASRLSALPPDEGSTEAVPHWSLPGLGRIGQVGDWSWAILRQTEATAREVSLAWSQ